MKTIHTTIERFNVVETEIAVIESEIKTVSDLPYYKMYNKEWERERDLSNLYEKQKAAMSKRHSILEDLKRLCIIELDLTSRAEREISLKKNAA